MFVGRIQSTQIHENYTLRVILSFLDCTIFSVFVLFINKKKRR